MIAILYRGRSVYNLQLKQIKNASTKRVGETWAAHSCRFLDKQYIRWTQVIYRKYCPIPHELFGDESRGKGLQNNTKRRDYVDRSRCSPLAGINKEKLLISTRLTFDKVYPNEMEERLT